MSHFNLTHKSFRGFTLIELLVVIAIIGLLGTVVMGPLNTARNKAKDAKKIADLKSIQTALIVYGESIGQFPATLGALSPNYLDIVPGNVATAYTPQADKYLYIIYNTGTAAAPRYTGYHLATKLSVTGNQALDADADCSAATCAIGTIAATSVTNWTSTSDPGAPANATTDIAATADTAATACTAVATTCVYDLRGNIF